MNIWVRMTVCLCWLASTQVLASGMVLHMWMADQAVSHIEDQDLKDLLAENRASYRYGSIFPDTGYAINHPYGEIAHWGDFMNAYYTLVNQTCTDLVTKSCRALFTHFLGSVSHSIADINFDAHFLTKAANVDYSGDINLAQKWIDTGLDIIALVDNGRSKVQPWFEVPSQTLAKVFARIPNADVTVQDIRNGARRHRLGMAGEPIFATLTYHHFKRHLPWAAQNVIQAPGGVNDTARKIGAVWQLLWRMRHEGPNTSEPFVTDVRWPLSRLWINGQSLEDF